MIWISFDHHTYLKCGHIMFIDAYYQLANFLAFFASEYSEIWSIAQFLYALFSSVLDNSNRSLINNQQKYIQSKVSLS